MSDREDIERDIAEENELSELLRPSERGMVIPPFADVAARAQRRDLTPGFALATAAALLIVVVLSIGMWRAATAPTATPTPSGSATPSPAFTRVPPEVANQALSALARETGRSEVGICLYVDPNANIDASAALTELQNSVTALVRQGFTVLDARSVTLCTEAPHFLRTNSVHPKNSANGVVVGVPTVTSPGPFMLVVVVTTPSRIATVFGSFPSHRGSEEVSCTGDNCGPVTLSIYAEPSLFGNPQQREQLIFEGFGLLAGR